VTFCYHSQVTTTTTTKQSIESRLLVVSRLFYSRTGKFWNFIFSTDGNMLYNQMSLLFAIRISTIAVSMAISVSMMVKSMSIEVSISQAISVSVAIVSISFWLGCSFPLVHSAYRLE